MKGTLPKSTNFIFCRFDQTQRLDCLMCVLRLALVENQATIAYN